MENYQNSKKKGKKWSKNSYPFINKNLDISDSSQNNCINSHNNNGKVKKKKKSSVFFQEVNVGLTFKSQSLQFTKIRKTKEVNHKKTNSVDQGDSHSQKKKEKKNT